MPNSASGSFSDYENKRKQAKQKMDETNAANAAKVIQARLDAEDQKLVHDVQESVEQSRAIDWDAIRERITNTVVVSTLTEAMTSVAEGEFAGKVSSVPGKISKKFSRIPESRPVKKISEGASSVANSRFVARAGEVVAAEFAIKETWIEFAQSLANAGSKFYGYFSDLGASAASEAQRNQIKDEIEKLVKGVETNATKLNEKVDELVKKSPPGASLGDALGEVVNIVMETKNIAFLGRAIHSDIALMGKLSQSTDDFSYWLTRQLAKRRLFQNELQQVISTKETLGVSAVHEQDVSDFLLKSKDGQNGVLKKLLGVATLSQASKLSFKEYRRSLQSKLNELIEISKKNPKDRTPVEREKLKNNEELKNFLVAADGSISDERLIALTAHFEIEKIMRSIARREELIGHRVIAEMEVNKRAQEDDKNKAIQNVLSESIEKGLPDFVPHAYRDKSASFIQFAHDVQYDSARAKRAVEATVEYRKQLSEKINARRNQLEGRFVLVVSTGLKLGVAITAFITAVFPPAALVTVPLGLTMLALSAIFEYAAERVRPGIKKESDKAFGHFSSKIKKQKDISKKMKSMKDESEGISVSSLPQGKPIDSIQSDVSPRVEMGIDFFSTVQFKLPKHNDHFSNYNAGRVLVKEDKAALVAEAVLKQVDPAQAVLIAQVIEGDADWAGIASSAVSGEGVKEGLEKIGIHKSAEGLISTAAAIGAKIQGIFKKTNQDALVDVQRLEILKQISDLSKKAEVSAEELKKKIDDFGSTGKTPVTKHIGKSVQVLLAIKQLAFAGHALRADVKSHETAIKSKSDFGYWLDRQLAKRQLLLNELQSVHTHSKDIKLDYADRQWIDGMQPDQLAHLQKNLLNTLLITEIQSHSIESYRQALQNKLNELVSVLGKEVKSAADLEWLNANRELIDHLIDKDQNHKFEPKPEVMVALVAHLEKEKLMSLLAEKEQLIQDRVLARIYRGGIKEGHAEARDLAKEILNKSTEQSVPDFIVSASDRKKAGEFADFVNDLNASKGLFDLSSDAQGLKRKRIDEAFARNHEYMERMQLKIDAREKRVIAKSLMVTAAAFTVVGAVFLAFSALCPPLALAAISLMFVSAGCGFAAERVSKGVTAELQKSFTHHSEKIRKHDRIAEEIDGLQEKAASRVSGSVATNDNSAVQDAAPQHYTQSERLRSLSTNGSASESQSVQSEPKKRLKIVGFFALIGSALGKVVSKSKNRLLNIRKKKEKKTEAENVSHDHSRPRPRK